MSTEPEPTQPAPEPAPEERQPITQTEPASPDPFPEPVQEPEPEEEPAPVREPELEENPEPEDETPPPPDLPDSPVILEPATWYEVETVCLTEDTGRGEPCRNLNTTIVHPEVYSNAGDPFIYCGPCSQKRTILSATKLDPQPEMT